MSPHAAITRALAMVFYTLRFLLTSPYHLLSRLSSAARKRECAPPLPPGSMGLPYIGETFQLYSYNPINFFSLKQKRYGPIFKTHILGCPCVMVSSPEAAKFVLLSKSNLFKPTFPGSKERMLGRRAIFFQQGEYHHRLRNLVLRAFSPDSIRSKVPNMEAIAVEILRSWEARGSITTFTEMKAYTFEVALLSIFGGEEIPHREELKQCYLTLEKGYNSLPINLPGTLFHKAMKSRRRLEEISTEILASRIRRRVVTCDFLGTLMEASLTDEQITDNIIGVIFAALDTTASVLTWVLKFLTENPSVLATVTEEQEEIRRNKSKGEAPLCWEDTKRMPQTWKVLQESLRVASILSFTFREAVQDVEYDGFLIPKGWKVMPLFRNIHHNPEIFPDPEKFDPSRFEASPKPNTFLAFGCGIHACPGNELAKLEILVLLHHLVTRYRWSACGQQGGIQFGPFALPMHGFPITFSLKQQ